jgi:hypothetical protein
VLVVSLQFIELLERFQKTNDVWRCRESNPGPLALIQSFYGRSAINAFSVQTLTCTSSLRTQLQIYVPINLRNTVRGKSSGDVRSEGENKLRVTDNRASLGS